MALALPLLLCFSPKSFQTRPQHPHLTNKKAEARSSCKASALVASEDVAWGENSVRPTRSASSFRYAALPARRRRQRLSFAS